MQCILPKGQTKKGTGNDFVTARAGRVDSAIERLKLWTLSEITHDHRPEGLVENFEG
jgi:hypothetical protein